MSIALPTREQAAQFALMLTTGVPASEAVRYFLPEDVHPDVPLEMGERWRRSAAVRDALVAQQKGDWATLTPEARIKLALDKHYNEMAFFLYTTNYGELEGPRKAKADSCRQALEVKLAGLAGKMDALSRFYTDMLAKEGALKVAPKH